MNITDEEIVNLILKGNGHIFEEIVKRYDKKIYNIAFRFTGNKQDSLDITQEILLKAYNSLKKYNSKYKFSSWILKITTNYCLDIKKKKEVETISLDIAVTKGEALSAEKVFIDTEDKKLIDECIRNLPHDYKIIIELYHKQNLSYQEIADILKLPMTKVKNRLYRARIILKDKLKSLREENIIWNVN